MKELCRKKSVKAVMAVIVLMLAIGIFSISTQNFQKKRDYNRHIDAAEKYLLELDYEQAIVEYTLALEIEPNSKEILGALEETYLDYAQTFADREEYGSAIEVAERGYAQIGGEKLQVKMEELSDLQAQKEKEEKQRQQEKTQEPDEAPEEKQEQEAPADEMIDDPEQEKKPKTGEESDKLAAYQTKAAEYIFSMQKEYYGKPGGYPFVDVRKLKTQEEFYEYFNNGDIPQNERGICVGAVNTSLLEETETQCRILVTSMLYNSSEMETGWILYFEFVIDKATEHGTLADFYDDYVEVIDFEGISVRGTVINHNNVAPYSEWKGLTFDFSE